MDFIKGGMDPKEAIEKATGTYGRYADAEKFVKTKDLIQLKWLNQFNQYVLIMLVGLTQ